MGYAVNKDYKGQVTLNYANIEKNYAHYGNQSADVVINYWVDKASREAGDQPMYQESYFISGERFVRNYMDAGSSTFTDAREPAYHALNEDEFNGVPMA